MSKEENPSLDLENIYINTYETLLPFRDNYVRSGKFTKNEATGNLFGLCAKKGACPSSIDVIEYIFYEADCNDTSWNYVWPKDLKSKFITPNSAFTYAIRNHYNDLVEFFIFLGQGKNPENLHIAVRYNNLVVLELLINNNSYINKVDSYGNTPLDIALKSCSPCNKVVSQNIIKLLVRSGADLSSPLPDYDSPLITPLLEYTHIADEIFYGKKISEHSKILINNADKLQQELLINRLTAKISHKKIFGFNFISSYTQDIEELYKNAIPKKLFDEIYNLASKIDNNLIEFAVFETPLIAICEKEKGLEISPTPYILIKKNNFMDSQARNGSIYNQTKEFYEINPIYKVPGNYIKFVIKNLENGVNFFPEIVQAIKNIIESSSFELVLSARDSYQISKALDGIIMPADETIAVVNIAGNNPDGCKAEIF